MEWKLKEVEAAEGELLADKRVHSKQLEDAIKASAALQSANRDLSSRLAMATEATKIDLKTASCEWETKIRKLEHDHSSETAFLRRKVVLTKESHARERHILKQFADEVRKSKAVRRPKTYDPAE